VTYTSDYFPQLYQFALRLIDEGKAYVDDCSQKEIKENRDGGKTCAHRDRNVLENKKLFLDMKKGKVKEGVRVLRMKWNMTDDNMNMRDPIIYRFVYVYIFFFLFSYVCFCLCICIQLYRRIFVCIYMYFVSSKM
jgi:glutaminyl-tRNA synthetase